MNVFLFPGQGSQEVGMAADLFKSDAAFRSLVSLASTQVGEDLEPVCLRGPQRRLTQTRFLQPLLVAVSLGYLRVLTERGVRPDLVLGHSLGEITALAAAGIVSPEDAVLIAAKRGELMDTAAAQADGGMLAVTTTNRLRLLEWLASNAAPGNVVLANDNTPEQLVLSGQRAALAAAAEFVATEKLGQCRTLSVSGPWHSPFMADAATRFESWLGQIAFGPAQVPMLFNANADTATDPAQIRSLVSGQLAKPVRWTECMAAVRSMQPRALFEVGPGRVLSSLARANGFDESTGVYRVNDLRGIELAIQAARANGDLSG